MSCEKCSSLEGKSNLSLPHVIRICGSCGSEYRVREEAEYGLAFKIRKGDKPVLPAGFLKFSANPLKSSGSLTRHGVGWFAEMMFKVEIAKNNSRDRFLDIIEEIQESNEEYFKDSDILKGLDLESESDSMEVFNRINETAKSTEWWGYMAAGFCFTAREAIKAGDALTAAWAMASAERFRALAVFKDNFEEVVFMGHSAGRLVQLIRTWDANRSNAQEGFWQRVLTEHAYAFSQLFSAPVTFLQGNAYVGGSQIDGKDARYLDFMLTGGSANHALIVEIKTPVAPLMSGKYRKNVSSPSRELSGSIIQIQDYTDTLRRNIDKITNDRNIEINTFNPRRIILIGDYENQLQDAKIRSSFELFRSSLAGIEIVTFDEFFRKIEQLAKLFNLIRTPSQNIQQS